MIDTYLQFTGTNQDKAVTDASWVTFQGLEVKGTFSKSRMTELYMSIYDLTDTPPRTSHKSPVELGPQSDTHYWGDRFVECDCALTGSDSRCSRFTHKSVRRYRLQE